MKSLNRQHVDAAEYPERIVQFGEGNFLRAFANWIVHKMNKTANFNSGVAVVQPIENGLVNILNEQDGLYTLYLNGIKNGNSISEHEIIDCIQRGINPYENYSEYLDISKNPDLRFVFSNTTEAGIAFNANDKLTDAPQKSFPGKLTALLYHRFKFFDGASDKGLIIIPCELIDRNGDNLREIILTYARQWDLGSSFIGWIKEDNIFCNTLVDRIVPGYPKDKIDYLTKELGYKDNLVVEGEQFHLWVIEGPDYIKEEFPSEKAGLQVIFTDNMEPYRTRKVRILNGAHTTLVPVGYLYGIDKVRESIEDEVVGKFIKDAIFSEICPTLDLPESELSEFSNDVLDRFRNPYLEHELISISLNSISKFKTRVLPSLLEYVKRKDALPNRLVFSLASLIVFYRGKRNGETINLNDNQEVLNFFKNAWEETTNSKESLSVLTKKVLTNQDFWDMDLTEINGISEKVTNYLYLILDQEIQKTIEDEFILE